MNHPKTNMIHTNHFFRFLHKNYIRAGLGFLLVGVAAIITLFALRTHMPIALQYASQRHSVTEPIVINLNQILQPLTQDQLEIAPHIEGTWAYTRGNLLRGDSLTFIPHGLFRTDTTYEVRIKQAKRIIMGAVDIPTIRVTTEEAPGIAQASFQTGDKPILAADHVFTVELSEKNRKLRALDLSTDPKIDVDMTVDADDKTFSWRPKQLLPQGEEIRVVLKDTNNGDTLIDKMIAVASEPALETPVVEYNFGKNDKATMVFGQPMLADTTQIEFSLAGTGAWKDDRTYVFSPDEVKPGMMYTYKITRGARSKQGGMLTQDIVRHFSTPGHVASVALSPLGRELSQVQQDIRITFNQPVNTKSAESRFSVSHGALVGFRWEGATMIATVKDLGFQNTVSYRVAPGVEPVFGLTSSTAIEGSFTTEARVIKLNVPYYKQQFAQSCEAASLRMALAYRGIQSSDWDILQTFGYAPRSKDAGSNSWDDPQKQFVGDVNGDQAKGTGWGVYAEPVAAATRQFGRSATTQYGVSASFLAQQIYNDRPVILWGIWGSSANIQTWNTPDGGTASGPFPMHVRLVVGVKGSVENPQGFYVNDPITGSAYWTTSQLMSNSQKAGPANQAVVVH